MGKYRNIFFSEAIALIEPKLCIDHWKVLYKLRVYYVDRNSKMITTAAGRRDRAGLRQCLHLRFLISFGDKIRSLAIFLATFN